MRRLFALTLALAVISLSAVSCRLGKMHPEQQPTALGQAVKFTVDGASFDVKASDGAFENGDLVGIFADSPINRTNVKGSVSGTSLIPESEIKWTDNQTVTTSFAAYFPFEASVTGKTFSFAVKEDQTGADGYFASDLRASIVKDVAPNTTVAFSLKHILSKLTLNVTCEDAAESVQAVTVGGIVTDASIDLSVPKATYGSNKASVKAGAAVAANGSVGFVAVLVPQTATITLDVVTGKGRSLKYTLESPKELESGKAYKADITVPKEIIPSPGGEVTFTITTEDWTNGGSLSFIEGEGEGGSTPVSHDGQWSVVGLGGDWNTDIWMTETSSGVWEVEITYNEGDAFKLRKDGKWSSDTEKHDEAGMPGDAVDPVPCDGSEYGLWGEYGKDIVLASTGKFRLTFVTEGYHLYVNPV